MTKKEKLEVKRIAKRALAENNIKVNMKDMILLELASNVERFGELKWVVYSYIMLEDNKTGKTYQLNYGKEYNRELDTLWEVNEYVFGEYDY